MIYKTFSSAETEKKELPYEKFRLCFCLDKPITATNEGEFLRNKIIEFITAPFGEAADQSIKDAARLIYGTNSDNVRVYNWVLKKDAIVDALFTQPQP